MKGVNILIICLISAVFLVGGFILKPTTEAYNNTVTHPLLTQKIAELYNAIYDPDLTEDEIQSLMAGSTDEDTPPRWINHFYDPTTELGWSGERLGSMSSIDVLTAAISAFSKEPESAVSWAKDQELQNTDYFLYQGDRTLNSAVLYSLEGKDVEAYYSLGYVLHLVEDMTVPAHTRQDTHVDLSSLDFFSTFLGVKFDGGEPYEKWAEENGEISQDTIDYLKNNYQPICGSLESCLTYLAKYSNGNFFSEDSIMDSNYKLPVVSKYIYKDKYIHIYNNENILLAEAKIEDGTDRLFDTTTNFDEINQSYWDRLSPAAILAGVEVVKYFNDQVNKAENKEITLERPKKISFWQKVKTISPYGEIVRLSKYASLSFINPFQGWGYDDQQGDDQPNTQSPNLLTDLEITPENAQERMDDLQELIDLLNGSKEDVNPFTPPSFELPSLLAIEPPSLDQPELGLDLELPSLGLPSLEIPVDADQQSLPKPLIVLASKNTISSGGGGGSSIVYQKILISEIQISGTSNEKEEFVELYNPNNEEVDLSKWEVKRKTKTGKDYEAYAPQGQFNGKKISAKGYFLIARKDSSFESVADMVTTHSLGDFVADGGSSLVLRDPNNVVVDKVGFGQAQDFETAPTVNPAKGESIGRRWDETNQTYFDTDSNSSDFGKQSATPKGKNVLLPELTVSCSALPNPVEINNSVAFTSLVSGGSGPYIYSWTGDCVGSLVSCDKSFVVGGTYSATINVIAGSQTGSASCSVEVSDTPVPPPTDTKAPTIVFNLPAEQQNLTFDVAFNITDLSIENVSPSGLQAFQLKWKEESGDWQEDAPVNVPGSPASYDGTRSFIGTDEKTYYFQVRAKDVNSNESDWLPEIPATTRVRTLKTVLINEIQTDSIIGTGGTDDDWVELYNPNDVDVSMQGWSVQKHSKSDPCGIESGYYKKNFSDDAVIPARGFYLIVDTQAKDPLLAVADMTIGWSLSDDNTVYLVRDQVGIESGDDSDIIDKVGFGGACFPEGSATANPSEGKSIERKITGVDTNNNVNDFQTSITPTPKTDILIEDVTDYATCGGSSSPGTVYCYLKLKWQSASSVAFYQVQYNKNDMGWRDWVSNTTDTEKTYQFPENPLINSNMISFRVRAQDTMGNLGEWSQIDIDLSSSIVINELALWGTDAGPVVQNQWIELYNKSDSPVDLTGWKLLSGYGYSQSLDVTLQGIVPAKGYYILERVDDQSLSDISANQVYPGHVGSAGYFNLLTPNSRKVDSGPIGMNDVPEEGYIKDGHHYSMERISAYGFGFDTKNWQLNDGITINGHDKDGNLVYGTPGQQNSVNQLYTPVPVDFVEDVTLTKSLSPYYFHQDAVTVFENRTLTIEPGVTVKFSLYSGIQVLGTLKAIGTTEEPIILTTFYDVPNPGYWMGIRFESTSKNSELEKVNLSYAGQSHAGFGQAGITVDQSFINLRDSSVGNNARYGLRLINSASIIDGLTTSDQMGDCSVYACGSGIYIEGGSPTITNSNILRNYYGINMADYFPVDGSPLIPATPYLENNYYEGNTNNIWPVTAVEL